ncbi:hypothetical protein [Promicromonospora sukumoe]
MPADDEPHEARHIRRWGDPPEGRLDDFLRSEIRGWRELAAELLKAAPGDRPPTTPY